MFYWGYFSLSLPSLITTPLSYPLLPSKIRAPHCAYHKQKESTPINLKTGSSKKPKSGSSEPNTPLLETLIAFPSPSQNLCPEPKLDKPTDTRYLCLNNWMGFQQLSLHSCQRPNETSCLELLGCARDHGSFLPVSNNLWSKSRWLFSSRKESPTDHLLGKHSFKGA